PFYFSGLITLINIVFIILFFHDKKSVARINKKIQWLKLIRLFTGIFTEKKIIELILGYFITQLGWQIFYIYTPLFVTEKLQMTSMQISIVLALIGLGIGLGCAVLPNLFKRYRPESLATSGYLGLFLGNVLLLVVNEPFAVWLIVTVTASCFGLAAVNVLTMLSNQTNPDRQGWMMGITGAIVALTGALGAIIVGFLANLGLNVPYLFVSLNVIIGVIFLRKKYVA
ncbi:MAG: MFS transporter, partial [Pseudomonadota bacterium]